MFILYITSLYPLYIGSDPSKQDCIKNQSLLTLKISRWTHFTSASCQVLMDPNYVVWILTAQRYIRISICFPYFCLLLRVATVTSSTAPNYVLNEWVSVAVMLGFILRRCSFRISGGTPVILNRLFNSTSSVMLLICAA
jgi:hypothetical protein